MPNIAITTYCNLKCPYCFAQDMFNDKNIKNISIKQFDKILNWILPFIQENHSRIGIIGGEPLLHPEFNILMEKLSYFCYLYKTNSLLFTNGIYLNEQKISIIPDNMRILINYNNLKQNKPDYFQKLNNNLKLLNELNWYNNDKVILGLNLCKEITNYNFFKDIILKYPFKKFRLAVAFPGKNINMNDYYLQMKNYFLDIIDFSINNNLKINMDCRIPYYYFSEKEQEKIFKVCNEKNYKRDCLHPQHEIMPDFTMTTCFAQYKNINCNKYNNFKEYWLQEIQKKNV